jgi:hypothetical protein
MRTPLYPPNPHTGQHRGSKSSRQGSNNSTLVPEEGAKPFGQILLELHAQSGSNSKQSRGNGQSGSEAIVNEKTLRRLLARLHEELRGERITAAKTAALVRLADPGQVCKQSPHALSLSQCLFELSLTTSPTLIICNYRRAK